MGGASEWSVCCGNVIPGGGPTPGGGVWFVGCKAELVEGDGMRYSRSSSSRVTALEPGGRDGEPLACEAWKYNKFHKGILQDAPQSIWSQLHIEL